MPNFILKRLILPAMSLFPYESYFVESHLGHVNLWDSHDLSSSFITISLGVVIYVLFNKLNLFKLNFPSYLSIEYLLYLPVVKISMIFCNQCTVNIDGKVNLLYRLTGKILMSFCNIVGEYEHSKPFHNLGKASKNFVESVGHLDQKTNLPLSDSWSETLKPVKIDPESAPVNWNFSNLNFNALLIPTAKPGT